MDPFRPFSQPAPCSRTMEFIVTTPDDFDDAPTGPSTSSPPSPPKSKQWMPIVRNLLTKKLPQTEQDWDRMLRTQADVNRMLHRLVLSHLSPAERAALSWQALFTECGKHLELLSRDEGEVGLCELFRLAIVGLAVIAMEDLRSDKTYQFLRQCLRPYCQSGQHLGDEGLRKTVKAVREGIWFVESFTDIFGSRSNELPLYGIRLPLHPPPPFVLRTPAAC